MARMPTRSCSGGSDTARHILFSLSKSPVHAVANWLANKWVALQYFGGIYYLVGCLGGNGWCFPCEEVKNALKIGEGALAEIDRGHV